MARISRRRFSSNVAGHSITVAALMLALSGIAHAQLSLTLSKAEQQQAIIYGRSATVSAGVVELVQKQLAVDPKLLSPARKFSLGNRLQAVERRHAEAQGKFDAWETQTLAAHHADANSFKVDWIKGLIVKR